MQIPTNTHYLSHTHDFVPHVRAQLHVTPALLITPRPHLEGSKVVPAVEGVARAAVHGQGWAPLVDYNVAVVVDGRGGGCVSAGACAGGGEAAGRTARTVVR